jgi:hypothetical protein
MAQGLEGIIVERYYQANAADASYTSAQGYSVPLTEGAVTYRVYVDMAAGYKFVQMFGTPTQNLVFNTTTSFYNDENYDTQTAPAVSVLNTKKHTAMIDSWLTAGVAATGKVGVPKDEDNDGSIANPHTNGILGNTLGGCFGSMITGATGKDGLLASSASTVVSVNTLGMGGSILNALTAGNSLGNITVTNGSLAALGGIVGAGASNKVLIGQFTTDGVFTFNINVQLLNPSGQAVNYVHSNAGAGQLTNASLIRTAGSGASVSMVASINNICAGESVTFTATPANAGATPSYQWKVNGTNAGTDAATFTSTTLVNSDVVSCTMTPGCDAQTLSAVNSNSVTMTVNTPTAYYADGDNDTYGAGTATNACTSPGAGYVTNNTDCNDASASVHPGASEICNAIDDDCNGTADNGLTFVNYYNDLDGDTYGAGAATNACTSPGAGYVTNNTDCNDSNANSYPSATEVCGNGVDEDCSGADLVCPGAGGISSSINVPVVGNYGTGAQTNLSVNLVNGTNSVESPGIGNDLWYSFVAQYNAVRIALTGSSLVVDDNDLGLYNNPATTGIQLVPIATENDVHPGAQGAAADGGSETLLYGQLTVGNTYYVCVRNNNAAPGTVSLNISYLRGSQNDISAFTGNTNIYSNTCANYKAAFRSGGQNYIVNRWSSSSMTGTPLYSYTIPTGTITQLGRIVPANLSGAPQTVYTSVNVVYNLPDAFGNLTTLTANGTTAGAFTLNSEAAVTVRSTDQCAATFKSVTSGIVTDRGVCGASLYNWQFTMVSPTSGLPISVNGAAGGSRILALSSVAGIANGQRYDVKVRPLHLDGASYSNFSATAACVKTLGAAGMVLENDNDVVMTNANSKITVYPNPSNGTALNINWPTADGLVKVMVLDATGKIVSENVWFAENGLMQTISFNEKLSSGIYNIALIHNNETQVVRFSVVR